MCLLLPGSRNRKLAVGNEDGSSLAFAGDEPFFGVLTVGKSHWYFIRSAEMPSAQDSPLAG